MHTGEPSGWSAAVWRWTGCAPPFGIPRSA